MDDSLSKYDVDIKRYLKEHYENKISYISDTIIEYKNNRYGFGRLTETDRNSGVNPVHVNLDFVKEAIEEDKKLSGTWNVELQHPKDKQRKYFEEFIGKKGQIIMHLLTCKRKTINGQDEVFEKFIIGCMVTDGEGWKLLDPQRGEKILELDVVSEKEQKVSISENLSRFANELLDKEKQNTIEDNEEYVDREMQLIDSFMTDSLLRFKKEIDKRENELKDLNKQLSRGSRTMGFYERQEVRGQIDKKQQELFKAQKKYFQAQALQFTDKEKRVTDLKSKLHLNFELKHLADVQFIISA